MEILAPQSESLFRSTIFHTTNRPFRTLASRSQNNVALIRVTSRTLESAAQATVLRRISDNKEGLVPDDPARVLLSVVGAEAIAGLTNLGNTCFMNSILQCLLHTRPLLEYCLSGQYKSDVNKSSSLMKGALISAYVNLMESISGGKDLVTPHEFKSQIARFAQRFVGYSQHDAHEFLMYLLDGFHEDLNRTPMNGRHASSHSVTSSVEATTPTELLHSDSRKASAYWHKFIQSQNSKIIDIFVGHLRSTLTCTQCGHCSDTFEPFLDLSVPINKTSSDVNLQDCLEMYMQEESLEGDDSPTCDGCKQKCRCTKRFSIQKFPQVLIIHLKRFSQGMWFTSKLSTQVKCPKTLDLSPFTASAHSSVTAASSPATSSSLGASSPATSPQVMYSLYAVSNHSGSTGGGHYTASAKQPYKSEWHHFNDSRVSDIAESKVISSDAYILFYELIETTSSRL